MGSGKSKNKVIDKKLNQSVGEPQKRTALKVKQSAPTQVKTQAAAVKRSQTSSIEQPKTTLVGLKTNDEAKEIGTRTSTAAQKQTNGELEARPKSNHGHARSQQYDRPKTARKSADPRRFMQIKREKTLIDRTQDGNRTKSTKGDTRLRLAVMRAKSVLDEGALKPSEDQILCGNVSTECPPTAKIVRIFTSSTFTDTMHERNALMETTYPRLKQFCQKRGYEFQVVDMRWGVREEATDDHMGLELCIKELQLCQKLSTGPNFVTLLSHKYGYRLFPRQVLATEFDVLFQNVQDSQAKKLLQKWFRKDDNAVPQAYILQSISTHLPDFLSSDPSKKSAAKEEWWNDSEIIRDALEDASQALDPKDAQKYIMSVTEAEITEGLLNAKMLTNPVWMRRKMWTLKNRIAVLYSQNTLNATGPKTKCENARNLMKNLRDERMSTKLPKNNILQYSLDWSDGGIDPDKNRQHRTYLTKVTSELEARLTSMIDDAIKEKITAKVNDPLFLEVLQHTKFCQTKCESFHGRAETLKEIQDYMKSDSGEALVVHGESGCGKTSILAMAAQQSWSWLKGKGSVVLRFLGTTPGSSGIRPLLASLTHQIRKVYHQDSVLAESFKELVEEFHESLELATKRHPLVVILDSLDQLDVSDGARQLSWFPRELPPDVKLIVSTLPEDMYEILPRLKTIIDDKLNFLSVPVLPDSEVTGIV
ncbi:hypothetical protein ScPMuIL_005554 [Solemya velum]